MSDRIQELRDGVVHLREMAESKTPHESIAHVAANMLENDNHFERSQPMADASSVEGMFTDKNGWCMVNDCDKTGPTVPHAGWCPVPRVVEYVKVMEDGNRRALEELRAILSFVKSEPRYYFGQAELDSIQEAITTLTKGPTNDN